MRISTFFERTLGANLANSRWSWGATNPTTNQLFLRVWEDDLEVIDGVERIAILRTDWDGMSAGFPERKRHVEALRNGAEGYGVLCTPKYGQTPGSQAIARFDQEQLLRFGELIDEGSFVYATVVERVPVALLARPKTSLSSVVPDLKAILAKRTDETTKETLANARVGQGKFREQVLRNWRRQCCVTGSNTADAIRASHIKPWRDSTDQERLDPNNGLPLVATLDALFDAGLITFDADGTLLCSNRLDTGERDLLGLNGCRLTREPNSATAEYLAYHGAFVFIDAQERNRQLTSQ